MKRRSSILVEQRAEASKQLAGRDNGSETFGPRDAFWAGVLLVFAFLLYAPSLSNDFVFFDDNEYVFANTHVPLGLTWENLIWAMTTRSVSNWHPLTWFSYMLDAQIWGLNPVGFHLTNVIFHALNAALVFAVLKIMTGCRWRSALVAGLFAAHPLHVESVAWVAERKDVLSTLFGLLAIGVYTMYSRKPTAFRYLAVIVLFALSLMAKPMLVTLPFVLLLLDFWPLKRLGGAVGGMGRLVVEKLPLLAISIASSAMTVWAQKSSGAIESLLFLSVGQRVLNAVVAYAMYLGKTVWPADLAVLYPHPGHWPGGTLAVSAVVLLVISAVAIRMGRSRSALLVGWLWFLGTLVPVIGLVQVGFQSMADRYTYVPLIGVFIMAVWSLPDRFRMTSISFAVATLLACSAFTLQQLQYWKDSEMLFTRTLAVTQRNFVAHYNLGYVFRKQNRNKEAIEQFQAALEIVPEYSPALDNLGNALAAMGEYEQAVANYRSAIRYMPDSAETYSNLGAALIKLGQLEQAIEAYRKSIEIDPKVETAHVNLGEALLFSRMIDEAAAEYRAALAINAQSVNGHIGLARALAVQGHTQQALEHFDEALRLDPGNAEATTFRNRLIARMNQSSGG